MGSNTHRVGPRGRPTTGPFGPSVVVLAALVAFAVGTRTLRRDVDRDSNRDHVARAPRNAVPESDVGVWLGHNSSGLVVRLAPLFREPERQVFDAEALAARLGLEPGQPFRLECCAHLPKGAQPNRDVRIEDDEGVALVPLVRLVAPDADPQGVTDPVLGLLSAPGSVAGGTVTVLWGRAPRAGARLVGAHAELGLESTFVVPLAPSTVASGQLPGSTLKLAPERLAGVEPTQGPR
ncbi:MAG: hypothetical protein GC161_12365 [Planctomycetaceae bacterium]|nr:hypothetical protein [Planctomycetaceae bacterium]